MMITHAVTSPNVDDARTLRTVVEGDPIPMIGDGGRRYWFRPERLMLEWRNGGLQYASLGGPRVKANGQPYANAVQETMLLPLRGGQLDPDADVPPWVHDLAAHWQPPRPGPDGNPSVPDVQADLTYLRRAVYAIAGSSGGERLRAQLGLPEEEQQRYTS